MAYKELTTKEKYLINCAQKFDRAQYPMHGIKIIIKEFYQYITYLQNKELGMVNREYSYNKGFDQNFSIWYKDKLEKWPRWNRFLSLPYHLNLAYRVKSIYFLWRTFYWWAYYTFRDT